MWIVVALVGVSFVAPTALTEDHCNLEVPGDHSTIQAAIDAANEGDTICIAAGTYSEALAIGKDGLTLEGDGQADTFIQGEESGSEATVRVEDVDGFTIRGVTIEESRGHAVEVVESSNVLIEQVSVRDFQGVGDPPVGPGDTWAEAIRIDDSDEVTISDVDLSQNDGFLGVNCGTGSPPEGEPGFNPVGGSTCLIQDSLITSEWGGVNIAGSITEVTITGNVIFDNPGRGVHVSDTWGEPVEVDLDDNEITTSAIGLNVATAGIGSLSVTGNMFEENTIQVDDTQAEHLELDMVLVLNSFDRSAVVAEAGPVINKVFSSIQDALDEASSEHRVVVSSGVYEESLVIATDSLALEATDAVLEGDAGTGVAVDADSVSVEGLTVSGFETGLHTSAGVTGLGLSGNSFEENELQIDDSEGDNLDLDQVLDENTFDRAVVVRDEGDVQVPKVFSSVVEALDAAGEGETVDVAAGEYEEALVITTNGIEIGGDGAVLLGDTGAGITVDADDVIIEGVEVSGFQVGLLVEADVMGLMVSGNTFTQNDVQIDDSEGEVLDLGSLLDDNTFDRSVVVRDNPIVVPKVFSSIQDAIEQAEDGQTVEAGDGVYHEELVVIQDGLTLTAREGAEPVLDGDDQTLSRGVDIDGFQDTTIEGFTIRGYSQRGISVGSDSPGVTVTNVEFVGSGYRAIQFHHANAEGVLIKQNTFRDFTSVSAIITSQWGSITDMQIVDNDFERTRAAISLNGNALTGPNHAGSGILIAENRFENVNGGSPLLFIGLFDTEPGDVIVENNEFIFREFAGGQNQNIRVDRVDNIVIRDNHHKTVSTTMLVTSSTGVEIRGNTIDYENDHARGRGIDVTNSADAVVADNVVKNMDLGNTFHMDGAIRIQSSSDVEVRDNLLQQVTNGITVLHDSQDVLIKDNVLEDIRHIHPSQGIIRQNALIATTTGQTPPPENVQIVNTLVEGVRVDGEIRFARLTDHSGVFTDVDEIPDVDSPIDPPESFESLDVLFGVYDPAGLVPMDGFDLGLGYGHLDVSHVDEEALRMLRYDHDLEQWFPVPPPNVVDTTLQQVYAEVTQTGTVGLFEVDDALFAYSGFEVSPLEPVIDGSGEATAEVSMDVFNVGTEAGLYEVEILIDGDKVHGVEEALDPDGEAQVVYGHIFTESGTFELAVEAEGFVVFEQTITVMELPVASFTFDPEEPEPGEEVTFDASASSAADGSIVAYRWDFTGDGVFDETTPNPVITHTFVEEDTFNVLLEVEDDQGLMDSITEPIIVEWEDDIIALVAWNPLNPDPGQEVTFDASAADSPFGEIEEYRWDFGDGNTDTTDGPVVTHTYDEKGSYSFSLEVEDETGATDLFEATIHVHDEGDLLWSVSLDDQVSRSSPTIVDGLVYVGDEEGNVYAFDASNGAPEWQKEVTGAVHDSPSVVNGMVYVGSRGFAAGEAGRVTALDASTGEMVWEYEASSQVGETTVFGTFVFAAKVSKLVALDGASGEELWSFDAGPGAWDAPVVADGTVYRASGDNLYALDVLSGEEQWSFNAGPSARPPTVHDGTVYVTQALADTICCPNEIITLGTIYALDADTGTVLWETSLGSEAGDIPLWTPTVHGDHVYVGFRYGGIMALDKDDGLIQWTFDGPGGPMGQWAKLGPTVAGGVLYFVGSDHLYALDAATGEPVWSFGSETESRMVGFPTVINGVVYTVDSGFFDGEPGMIGGETVPARLYAVDAGDGATSEDSRVLEATYGHHEVLPSFFQVSIDAPATVIEEELLEVEVTVRNLGSVDEQTVVLDSWEGTVSESVSLGRHEQETFVLSVQTGLGDAGFRTVSVSSEQDSASATIVILQVVEITQCMDIDTPGIYTLGGDLTTTDGTSCIVVTEGFVTIEGGGHDIQRDGSLDSGASAVYVDGGDEGIEHVVLRDFNVDGWTAGPVDKGAITFHGVTGGEISGVTVTQSYWGAWVTEAREVTIRDNVFDGEDSGVLWWGLYMLESPDNEVVDNRLAGAYWAFQLDEGSTGNLITGNNVSSSAFGFVITGANDNMIRGNKALDNTGDVSWFGGFDLGDFSSAADAQGNRVERLLLGTQEGPGVAVSFDQVNVQLNHTSPAEDNPGGESLGLYVAAEDTLNHFNTNDEPFLDLGIHFDGQELTRVERYSLAMWSLNEGEWEPVDGYQVDQAERVVQADVTDRVGAGGDAPTTFGLYVMDGFEFEESVPAGEEVTVSAGAASVSYKSENGGEVNVQVSHSDDPSTWDDEVPNFFAGEDTAFTFINVETQEGHTEDAFDSVMLSLSFDPQEVIDAGMSPGSMAIYYWNGINWENTRDYVPSGDEEFGLIEGVTPDRDRKVFSAGVDLDENRVWAELDRTSIFALGAIPASTPSAGGGGGGHLSDDTDGDGDDPVDADPVDPDPVDRDPVDGDPVDPDPADPDQADTQDDEVDTPAPGVVLVLVALFAFLGIRAARRQRSE